MKTKIKIISGTPDAVEKEMSKFLTGVTSVQSISTSSVIIPAFGFTKAEIHLTATILYCSIQEDEGTPIAGEIHILNNADEFHKFLEAQGIEYKRNGHYTTLLDYRGDLFALGRAWEVHQFFNRPGYLEKMEKKRLEIVKPNI